MNDSKLDISKPSASTFNDFISSDKQYDNLFVLTHLGQLKQMEALIKFKSIKNNCLVVLYTYKNLVVPQMVHDQYSDVFSQAVFIEIPFGVNKVDYIKLKKLEKSYQKLISVSCPKKLYLNSFEGHYAMLTSIAKSKAIQTILVEEGTATYKFNLSKYRDEAQSKSLSSKFIKDKFIATIGQTQIFKKTLKVYKYNKDLYKQTERFVREVVKDEGVQREVVSLAGGKHIKATLKPFKDFDKAYASFPNLIKEGFNIQDVEYFLVHEIANDEALQQAQKIIDKYDIKENDILYVSQRYNVNPEQYSKAVAAILSRMRTEDQTVFIKLHPKENKKIYDSFKYLEFASNGKFIVIEESQFLIESVIKLSKIQKLVGLTSTTLIYGSLVSPTTQAISIAKQVIEILSMNRINAKGVETIKQHLEIINVFDNIEFR